MTIFALKAKPAPNGDFNAVAFDDENGLWEDKRLLKSDPLAGLWNPPRLRLHPAGSDVTDVLYNPQAFAVADHVREALAGVEGIEFLPVQIEDNGSFFVLHITSAIEPSRDLVLRRPGPPEGNIIQIFEFPEDYDAPGPIFRVRQPFDSAAGRLGYCLSTIYATDAGAKTLITACGAKYLRAMPMKQGV